MAEPHQQQQQPTHGIGTAVAAAAGAVTNEVEGFGEDLASDFGQIGQLFQAKHISASEAENLFENLANALLSSCMIYGMADIRHLIREKRDQVTGSPDMIRRFLDLPCTDVEMLRVIKDNMALLESSLGEDEMNLYMGALKLYAKELLDKVERMGVASNSNDNKRKPVRRRSNIIGGLQEPSELVVFDDKAADRELVYAIFVDKERSKLGLIFRGSVTVRDFQVDSALFIQSVENPLFDKKDVSIPQSRYLGIHSGFQDYLFGRRKKRPGEESKFDQILAHLRRLLKQHPDYQIAVCGHSLGGALASLCAFRLATEEDLPKPIHCTTFASPRTGNISLVRAFQELEIQQKLICFRVANDRDLITLHPDRLNICTFPYQDAIFRHVGIQIKLFHEKAWYQKVPYQFRYRRVRRSRVRQFGIDFSVALRKTILHVGTLTLGCCVEDYLTWHSCSEYLRRLQLASDNMLNTSARDMVADYRKDVQAESEAFTLRPRTSSPRSPKSTRNKIVETPPTTPSIGLVAEEME